MSDLEALLKRVEEASGPDRELSQEISRALAGTPSRDERWYNDWHLGLMFYPPCTSSIDAAVALAERLFPECEWEVFSHDGRVKRAVAFLWNTPGHVDDLRKTGATPPLAMCAVILKAAILKAKAAERVDA